MSIALGLRFFRLTVGLALLQAHFPLYTICGAGTAFVSLRFSLADAAFASLRLSASSVFALFFYLSRTFVARLVASAPASRPWSSVVSYYWPAELDFVIYFSLGPSLSLLACIFFLCGLRFVRPASISGVFFRSLGDVPWVFQVVFSSVEVRFCYNDVWSSDFGLMPLVLLVYGTSATSVLIFISIIYNIFFPGNPTIIILSSVT